MLDIETKFLLAILDISLEVLQLGLVSKPLAPLFSEECKNFERMIARQRVTPK